MSVASEPNKTPDSSGAAKKTSKDGGIGELVKIIVHAFVIAAVVRTLLFQPFNIPSGSLIPTLLVGDYVMVSKYSYGWSRFSVPFSPSFLPSGRLWGTPPKRGDIAVFKLPKDNSTDFIKRVIGLPGDHIQMKGGRLFINGVMAPREPAGTFPMKDSFGRDIQVPLYTETLPNGVKHVVMEINGDNGYYDNTDEYVVPPDHYFMMGDNRDNSDDSRDLNEVGYVPFDNFVGKGQIIFFSVSDDESPLKFWLWPWTVRLNRLMSFIH
ncbi:signal peptidase I [Labrys monachus]|uniref:Signal peptidase I n=1 Tax=Labrys monachus TaxID=217067 RepID=A0ABU0FHQ0_9HYPH|nr:signal peptidase I [Labrys monachus]MDQ0394136.1 signal peptidase I [Labrys monachus]